MGFQGIDAFMEALIALPDRLDAGLAVPRAGSAAPALGQAPHHLAERRRGRRRVAVRRPGRNGVPLLGCKHHLAGHLGIGAAHHRALVAPPRRHAIERQGVQPSLSRLHASRLDPTPVREHPAKPFALPPTARPWHHQTGSRAIRHGQTREQAPCKRLPVAGWSTRLGLDGDDRNGGPRASWPAGASARHPVDGHAAGGLARRPVGRTRQLHREGARGWRLPPLLPAGSRGVAWAAPSSALGPEDERRPFLRCTPHRRQKPLRPSPFPSGHAHHARVRTALLDRTGPLIPWPPPVALLRCNRLAVALLRHRRLRPLPQRQPSNPQVHALGAQGHGRVEQRRVTDLQLHRPPALLGLGCPVVQKGRVLPQQDHFLRPHAL
jgi:hypothetical protein